MASVYANLIMKGKKTMEDVPEKLKDAVQALLDEAGWVPPENKQEEVPAK